MIKYKPAKIELKWQEVWEKELDFKAIDLAKNKKKFYALVEFPYPSGEGLHVGHARTYITLDVFARKKRMEGTNVLYPMGWDAFGLPTENYAIKTGVHPASATEQNTDRFRQQMKQLALAYNWEREINTTDPSYYQWTQWIFIQLFKNGLAYKKKMPINWCPSCKIGLANEEVVNGCCERCGVPVGQKKLDQWLLRITAYADRLASELDLVDFPESVVAAQRNWIGKSEGVEEYWQVQGMDLKLATFTTWLHTSWGATFLVIAPEHPVIEKLVKGTKYERSAKEFCQKIIQEKIKDFTSVEKEKKGFFVGRYAINHLTKEKMPIFIANFAVMEYGTGIVKGCPAHDQRDWDFAKKYNLKIRPVIRPKNKPITTPYIGEGVMINAGSFTGMDTKKAREAITDHVIASGNGKRAVNYHIRDWIFSRQHYWGEPIPIIKCQKCGWVPVPEEELPVKLPEVKRYQPTGTGESPLAAVKDWVKTRCPVCGGRARRETDTMPNWAGSSWYYLAYPLADKLGNQKANKENVFFKYKDLLNYWMPVDVYFGGAEHTTLHLLYSRFWHKFLNDLGIAPGKEPYFRRRVHGVVLGEDGRRMSKSKGNVITQDEVIKRFGADSLRVFSMFMGPYNGTFSWSTAGIRGTRKFLERFYHWFLTQLKKKNQESEKGVKILVNRLIKGVGEDIDNFKFNTAVAKFMEFLNKIERKRIDKKDLSKVIRTLAPFAPYLTEELWQYLGNKVTRQQGNKDKKEKAQKTPGVGFDSPGVEGFSSIHQQPWPKYDPEMVKEEAVTIIIEVDGKVRSQIKVRSAKWEVRSEIEKLAREEQRVKKYLAGKKIKRVVFVPGKLINFVTKVKREK